MFELKMSVILVCAYIVAAASTTTTHIAPTPSASPVAGECPEGMWWWARILECVPIGGMKDKATSTPSGIKCPKRWEWKEKRGIGNCTPFDAAALSNPCPEGYTWDDFWLACYIDVRSEGSRSEGEE
ncbi:unnamed protein product [Rhizoctonia solani]|uniref:Secreted protein n=1 Tax=Rhizoctonia solani TaxID=456999 RepID=A0A8H3B7P2_9AGAM|nr:unnamed protein product [Rhizoctonia solani]CAE6490149.1 unnamed protein product [Rhizoctonia solani]